MCEIILVQTLFLKNGENKAVWVQIRFKTQVHVSQYFEWNIESHEQSLTVQIFGLRICLNFNQKRLVNKNLLHGILDETQVYILVKCT